MNQELQLAYLSLAVERLGEMVIVTDLDHQITYANPAVEKILGYTPQELIGRPVGDIFDIIPENSPDLASWITEQDVEKVWRGEVLNRKKDGSIIQVHLTLNWLRDQTGKIIGSVGVSMDISDQRRTEQALRESEERFRNLTEYLPGVSIQGYQPDGTLFYWNKASEKIYGYPAAEAIGKNLGDLIIPPDIKPLFLQALSVGGEAKKSGEFLPAGELLLQDKEGRPVSVYSIHTAVYVEGKEPELFCIDIDLSERKKMESDLRQARDKCERQVVERTGELATANEHLSWEIEERKRTDEELIMFKTISDQANYGTVIADMEGNLTYLNQHFAGLHQYQQEELIGKNLSELHTKDQMEMVNILNKRLKTDGVYHAEEVWHKKKDGTIFPAMMNATVIEDEQGKPLFISATAVDITAKLHDDGEKIRMQEQLRQAQKMESAARMAGGMAHDFGNLLNAIRGYVEVIKAQLLDEDPLQNEIRELDETVVRAGSLIRKLLSFGRRQTIQPKNIDLNAIISEIDGMLRRICGRSIEMNFNLDPVLPMINADQGQMEQIIINLVINAKDAVNGNGEITIRTDSAELTNSLIPRIIGKQPGDYVVLVIEDNGRGMDETARSRIFEPFFTTKDSDNSSGLGLSIVYGIVEQSGGFIQLDSTPDQGTTFNIYFPAVKPAQNLPEADFIEGDKYILIMDDEAELRTVTGKMLKSIGCRVAYAKDGRTAIKLFREEKESGRAFDAVLLDLIIPGGGGGGEVIKSLIKIDPGIKAVLCSGYVTDPVVKNYRKYGFSGVLTKPFTSTELRVVLSELIGD